MKKNFSILVACFLLLFPTGTGLLYYYQYIYTDSEQAEYIEITEKIILPIALTTSSPSISPATIKVPILVYHSIKPFFPGETNFQKIFDVEPDSFAAQLLYLKTHGFTPINFDDLADYYEGKKLPAKPVIINFDDGWEDQYTYAFPLLQKENMKATFFIFSNAIGHRRFLNWDQVRALAEAGMTIGGHSKYHPYLWKISDPKKLADEIIGSKKITEDHIGRPITVFAYPFGRYSTSTVDMVKAAGYRSARSGRAGISHSKEDLFTLRSIQVGNDIRNFAAAVGK